MVKQVDASTAELISKMVRQHRRTLLQQHIETMGPIHKRTHKRVLWFRLSYYVQVDYYTRNNLPVPEKIQTKYDRAMRCYTFADLYKWGLVSSMAEKYGYNGNITSECPEFCNGWDPDEKDCKDCKIVFREEYDVCMEHCKSKIDAKLPVEDFYTFRQSSKAYHIISILESNVDISYDDLVRMVNDKYVLGMKNAGYLVTNYLNQWTKGMWVNKPVNFDFTIKVSNGIIKYRKKVNA